MPRPRVTAKRVTISLRQPDLENLEFIAACTGLSENDSVRKALATEAFVQEQLAAGATIMKLDGKTGKLHKVVFVAA